MTIQPTLYGVLRPEAMRTETGTETKPENLKRISAGDPAPIRTDTAAEKRKL